jgi:Na+/H+ antiporter NhaD/arsenite permease-like protein
MNSELLISALIFVGTYLAILTNKIERSLAAVTGAAFMVGAGLVFGFYNEREVITEAIDWNTIALLFGMMIVVGILKDTGLFETLAVWAAKLSRGDYFYMMLLFGILAALMSTTIDNVTTILLVAPISMSISSVLGIDPKPILLTQGLFANIGGVATLIGDPPNIMISTAGGFSYLDYIYNLAPTVIICTSVTAIVFKLIFSEKTRRENEEMNREALNNILESRPSKEISDWSLLGKSMATLVFIIVLFTLQSVLSITPATVALAGAALILMLSQPDMSEILERVEWRTLLFFAGLFVVVHGVGNTALLTKAAQGVLHLTRGNLLLSALSILFLSAVGSGLVDNIPLTAVMLPIIGTLSANLPGESNILWWALAFGTGFGGNATYIGSPANEMIVSLSEDHHEPITMKYWLKYSTVITLITTLIAGAVIAIQIISPLNLPFLPN